MRERQYAYHGGCWKKAYNTNVVDAMHASTIMVAAMMPAMANTFPRFCISSLLLRKRVLVMVT
jgi:hypothetical protein